MDLLVLLVGVVFAAVVEQTVSAIEYKVTDHADSRVESDGSSQDCSNATRAEVAVNQCHLPCNRHTVDQRSGSSALLPTGKEKRSCALVAALGSAAEHDGLNFDLVLHLQFAQEICRRDQ